MGRYDSYGRRKHRFWPAVFEFVMHVAAGFIMFSFVIAVAWGLSFFVAFLNAKHQFPDTVYQILSWVEIIIVALDALAFLAVLVFGVSRLLGDLRRPA